MRENKKYLILIITIVLISIGELAYSQEKHCTLNIEFIGKKYKEVKLLFINNDFQVDILDNTLIKGVSADKKNWTFIYDEEIYNMSSYVWLVGFDKKHRSFDITLTIPASENYLSSLNKNFEKNSSIKCKYDSTKIFLKNFDPNEKNIADFFSIINNADMELMLSIMIGDMEQKEIFDYIELLELKRNLILKHPDSHHLTATLASSIIEYTRLANNRISEASYYNARKEEYFSLYKCLSEKQKKSYWGQRIESCIINDK